MQLLQNSGLSTFSSPAGKGIAGQLWFRGRYPVARVQAQGMAQLIGTDITLVHYVICTCLWSTR